MSHIYWQLEHGLQFSGQAGIEYDHNIPSLQSQSAAHDLRHRESEQLVDTRIGAGNIWVNILMHI